MRCKGLGRGAWRNGAQRFIGKPFLAQTSFSLVGNESFNAATDLSAESQVWHSELLAQDVTLTSEYGLSYSAPDNETGAEYLGERLYHLITALLAAFSATGDLRILDRCDVLMEQAKHPLIDLNYMLTFNSRSHNGLFALLTQMIYVYGLNSGKTSPAQADSPPAYYAAKYQQWNDYLNNVFIPARGTGPFDNTVLRHIGTAYMRGAYYYWRISGNASAWRNDVATGPMGFYGYRAMSQAENRTDFGAELPSHTGQLLMDGRYVWQQELPRHDLAGGDTIWQPSHYARYTVSNYIDLALEGLYKFDDTAMETYGKTAEFIMANGVDAIRDNVYAETITPTMTAGQWRISGFIGLARWSDTIKALATDDYENVTGTNVHFPAWMLVATI